MKLTAEIWQLSFILLLSAIHCAPLPLNKIMCRTAEILEPQKLLDDLTRHLGLSSKHLNENNQRNPLTIPELDDVDSMDKTRRLQEFYKAFQRLKLHFSMLSGDNATLRDELRFHERQIWTIVDMFNKSLHTTPPPVSITKTQIESEYEKKLFTYKVVDQYVRLLNKLKKHFCFKKSH